MTSPAQRFSQARDRAAHPALTEFASTVPFPLDQFQQQACRALENGSSVLVCAPTGAGKTVVGEFAIQLGRTSGRKCFYTTPIKALSNQKYSDLVRQHGVANVGLLTGDNVINGDAPIVVMTTEVLRNMLYAGSQTLLGLGYVVMDEVHYLADRFRGAVWEEVLIHLPESVVLVSLSATVSNAEEFGDWLVTVRGHTEVVVSEHRPVPLWQHMMVGRRMFDLFAGVTTAEAETIEDNATARADRVNPQLLRYATDALRGSAAANPVRSGRRSGGGRRGYADRSRAGRGHPGDRGSARARGGGGMTPRRADVIARLDSEGLLPAITFIFSRAGCDAAVRQCLSAGLRLTDGDERAEIRRIAAERTSALRADDLNVLGYWEWLDGLMHGLAAHHAGMLPAFKQVVEELFLHGLVKAVFATETLALGINMPARSVVLERLVKFNGDQHVDITAGEYTQLTGRAGRRGIDVEGHAVVLWTPETDPRAVAGLASTRTYPLISSFKPSYNMAVNLVATVGPAAARALLETSFAQFQTDRSVVGLARQIRRNKEGITGYTGAMSCDAGDFAEYAQLRRHIESREKSLSRNSTVQRRIELSSSLEGLTPGDVIVIPGGRRAGLAVVLDPGKRPLADPVPLVLTEDHWAGRLSLTDFTKSPGEVTPLCRITVPQHFNHRSPKARRDLASTLRNTARELVLEVGTLTGKQRRKSTAANDTELHRLRDAMRRHPCHFCEKREEHARWAVRRDDLARETEKLERRVRQRTSSLARAFDQVCAILQTRGYVESEKVSPAGAQLSRIWSESDLLVAECLRHGVWDKLDPAELAAAVSAVVYEARGGDGASPPVPPGELREALRNTVRLWGELHTEESERGLSLTKEPDVGFVEPMLRWARGESLQCTLSGNSNGAYSNSAYAWREPSTRSELSAGDFVRWARQVLDLLDQIAAVATVESKLRSTATQALGAVRRGILAVQLP